MAHDVTQSLAVKELYYGTYVASAAVATAADTATGYITIKSETGTSYKILVKA